MNDVHFKIVNFLCVKEETILKSSLCIVSHERSINS